MITCKKCGNPYEQYSKAKRLTFWCQPCRSQNSKKNYLLNKDTVYAVRAPRRRFEASEFINRLKAEPCTDCNTSFHYCQMDFDHRDPSTKRKQISYMKLLSLDTIRAEIAKCDLVCANCHRDRTQKSVVSGSISDQSSYQRGKLEEITAFVNSLKGGKKCMDCEKPHPYWRLDFDHREGSGKASTISRLKLSRYSKERILEEVNKCDLVCARCHRFRTWNRQRDTRSGPT